MKQLIFINIALRFLGIGSTKTTSNARKSLYGAVLGIGISVIPLVVVLVVSDGMIQGITSRTIELGSGNIQIINMRPYSEMQNCETEIKIKEQLISELDDDFLTGAWIERQGHGLIIGKNGRCGASLRAIEPQFFIENKKAADLIRTIQGEAKFQDAKSAIIGKVLAEKLELNVGDICRVITLSKGKTTIPKTAAFKISGIISSGYQELDALWFFIPLTEGLKLMPLNTSLTSILLSVKEPFNEKKVMKFRSQLYNHLPETFSVYTWYELNGSIFNSFKTTKNILMFIMFLIALVASANISSALVMLVMERRKEIAILKATGTHPISITFSFLIAGLLTSLFGIIVGMPIGILASININEIFALTEKTLNKAQALLYSLQKTTVTPLKIHILDPEFYLENIPIVLNLKELYMIAAAMLSLSVVVCIIPAVKAAKEKPVESMRKI